MKDVLKEYREYLGEIDAIVLDSLQISRKNYLDRTLVSLESEIHDFIDDNLLFNQEYSKNAILKNYNYGITRFVSIIKNINNEYLHRMEKYSNLDEEVFQIISSHYDDIYFEVKKLDSSSSFDDVQMRTSTYIIDEIKHENYENKLFDSHYHEIKYSIRRAIEDNFNRELSYAKEEMIHSINRVFENFKDDVYNSQNNNKESLDTSVFGGGKKLVKALPNMKSDDSAVEVVEALPIDGIFK